MCIIADLPWPTVLCWHELQRIAVREVTGQLLTFGHHATCVYAKRNLQTTFSFSRACWPGKTTPVFGEISHTLGRERALVSTSNVNCTLPLLWMLTSFSVARSNNTGPTSISWGSTVYLHGIQYLTNSACKVPPTHSGEAKCAKTQDAQMKSTNDDTACITSIEVYRVVGKCEIMQKPQAAGHACMLHNVAVHIMIMLDRPGKPVQRQLNV